MEFFRFKNFLGSGAFLDNDEIKNTIPKRLYRTQEVQSRSNTTAAYSPKNTFNKFPTENFPNKKELTDWLFMNF